VKKREELKAVTVKISTILNILADKHNQTSQKLMMTLQATGDHVTLINKSKQVRRAYQKNGESKTTSLYYDKKQ